MMFLSPGKRARLLAGLDDIDRHLDRMLAILERLEHSLDRDADGKFIDLDREYPLPR